MFFSSPLYGALALAAALFCRMLGVFIVLPVAAPLVLARPDGSAAAAGLVLGGYGLTQALAQIPVGWLADRCGKKPVLLAALAVFAAGGFAAGAADSTAMMIAGRLLQGAGAVAAVAAAWIADIAPANRRSAAMAGFGAVIALAFAVSLVAAPFAAGQIGLSGIFNLTGWLGALSFALALTLPPPPSSPAVRPPPLRPLLANRALRRTGGGAFALHYAMATTFFLLPTTIALPADRLWPVYLAGFAAALPPAALMIMRVDRQPRRFMTLAAALTLAGVALLPAAQTAPAAVIALFFFFAGFTVLEAALPAAAARAAPPAARGAAMGIVMSCEFAGVFCGGAAAGFFSALINGKIAAAGAAALLAVWLIAIRRAGRGAAAASADGV